MIIRISRTFEERHMSSICIVTFETIRATKGELFEFGFILVFSTRENNMLCRLNFVGNVVRRVGRFSLLTGVPMARNGRMGGTTYTKAVVDSGGKESVYSGAHAKIWPKKKINGVKNTTNSTRLKRENSLS